MPALNRIPGTLVGLLAVLLLGSCGRFSFPALLRPAVGHIVGQIEPNDQGFTLVHLEAIGAQDTDSPITKQARVFIEGGRQQPRIAVVRPEQPLYVTNLDAIYHEIFTVDSDNPFRARLASGAESDPIRLRTPGFVRGYCRLHPHESYAFLITRADHIVSLEDDSNFAIPSVPVGEYRIGATGFDGSSTFTRFLVSRDQTIQLTLHLEQSVER
jgi:hypothetical protein